MKNSKIILTVVVSALLSLFLSACETNPSVTSQQDILPASFSVAIPSSISSNKGISGGRVNGQDTLSGNQIYQNLNTFIAVGAGALLVVEGFIAGIRKYNIEKIRTLTYISDEDNRTKNLVVTSSVSFEGQTWDYELTIADAEAGAADGGAALQLFWNKHSAVKGIAIIKPYNCDRIKNAKSPNAIFRIDYTEAGDLGYDATMEVKIAGLTLNSPLTDPFSISSLHMFVGKKGDNIDVSGNSNHPNAILFAGNTGFNWAFVASSSDSKNIAVAEVGLPPSSLDNNDRNVLLKTYSIKNVFTNGINALWPGIDQTLVKNYLKNTAAPGYFNATKGFMAAGVSPGVDWDVLNARAGTLTPFNPSATSTLVLTFK